MQISKEIKSHQPHLIITHELNECSLAGGSGKQNNNDSHSLPCYTMNQGEIHGIDRSGSKIPTEKEKKRKKEKDTFRTQTKPNAPQYNLKMLLQ